MAPPGPELFFVFVLQVKSEVRRLKGIPALVSMLDNPNKEVSLLIFSSFFPEVCSDRPRRGPIQD